MKRGRILRILVALAVAGLGAVLPGRAATAQPTPPGYPIRGVDVSYFQGPSVDWTALAAGGTRFAYVRASEQDGAPVTGDNPDPYYATNVAGARANGIYTGAYHRARPDLSSGRQQADVLLDFAPYVSDGYSLPPMLDIEWPRAGWGVGNCYGMTAAQLGAWIRDFVNEIAARSGRQAVIYTNTNWWNPCTGSNATFTANPLFLANYSQNPPPLPAGWSSFTFWQYAAGTPVAGTGWSSPDQDVFNGGDAALARLLAAPVKGLIAQVNSRYVTAEKAGTLPLIANRTALSTWERFDYLDLGGGLVALRAQVNGRYVTAESAGTKPLIANRTQVGSWERFRLTTNSDGTVSLLATVNNRYVTAESAGTLPLIANRTAIGLWEKFRLVDAPVVTSLFANINRRFVTTESAGTLPLIANRLAIGVWEQFDQIDVGGGFVAFRAHSNGRYVTAESYGTKPLIANRTAVGSWEKFRIIANADGSVSLLANVNNRYVTAESAGTKPLIANRTAIGTWEKFYRVTS
jgi:GH25 family lysozyme M1 (1,4-beta-N-acetylmuramidase)